MKRTKTSTKTTTETSGYVGDDYDDFIENYDKDYKKDQVRLTKEKKKEYYVKAEDLMNELKKYKESKASSPDGKGKISEELRTYDHEDLHTIRDASQVLRVYIQRRVRSRRCRKMHHAFD